MFDSEKYDHDIFVSYACVENEIPAGATKGWVTVFVKTLEQELAKTKRGKAVGIRTWWDESSIDRTHALHAQILSLVSRVRVMVVLLSPSYAQSKWCGEERDAFIEAMQGRYLGNQRIFLIDLGKLKFDERPHEFVDMSPYVFHDKETATKYGHPVPNSNFERHLIFFEAITEIAHDIVNRLNELDNGPPPPSPPHVATVFLAETTDGLNQRRREIAADLQQHGIRIIPERRLSSDLSECRQQIEKLIEQHKPRVFVQLLEDTLGKSFDESEETLVTLQHQVAANKKDMNVMQWLSAEDAGKRDSMSTGAAKTFLSEPCISCIPFEAFKSEVRLKAMPPKQRKNLPGEDAPPSVAIPSVFVDGDPADLAEAQTLSELFRDRFKLRSWWPKSSDDPDEQADYREIQQEFLQDCDAVFFVHRLAKPSKIELQMQRLWKIQQRRNKPFTLKALYLGPPPEQTRPSLLDPDYVQIDGSHFDGWNVDELNRVLSILWTPRSNGGGA